MFFMKARNKLKITRANNFVGPHIFDTAFLMQLVTSMLQLHTGSWRNFKRMTIVALFTASYWLHPWSILTFSTNPFWVITYIIFCHLATVIHRISADNMLLLPNSKCPKHCIRNSVRARQRTKEHRQRMFFVLVENHCFASVFFF